MRRTWALAVLAAAALTLSSCTLGGDNSSDPGSRGDYGGPGTSAMSPPAASGVAAVRTAPSRLGDIAVDAGGMTVYVFDQDEIGSGVSSCKGSCLQAWPPVLSESDQPIVEGIDAVIGVIPGPEGTHQITINGRPIYRYADDTAPGDLYGQAVGSVWWAVDLLGNAITESVE